MEARHRRARPREVADQGGEGRAIPPQLQGDRCEGAHDRGRLRLLRHGRRLRRRGDFRFNDIELVTDRREYAPGDKVNLLVNTARADSWIVLLFLRPSNGMYPMPKIVHAEGKSTPEVIEVAKKDMPNFFVEAFTVADGRVYTETREVIVPPESRILGVAVMPSTEKYKPGEKAVVKLKLTGPDGKPYVGSTVVSIYDKARRVHLRRLERAGHQGVLLEVAPAASPERREQPGPRRI